MDLYPKNNDSPPGIKFMMHRATLNGNGGGGNSGTSMSRAMPMNTPPMPMGQMKVMNGFSAGIRAMPDSDSNMRPMPMMKKGGFSGGMKYPAMDHATNKD